MAEKETLSEADELIAGPALEEATLDTSRLMRIVGGVIAGLMVLAFFVLYVMVENREKDLVVSARDRIEAGVAGRKDVLSTWLEGIVRPAFQITDSGLFRLFATEADSIGKGKTLPRALRNQLPYMQVAVTDFATKNGMTGAYMVSRDGRAYLASAAAPILTDGQRQAVRDVYRTGERTVPPLHQGKSGLVLDVLFPITPPQALTPEDQKRTIGVLLISLPATDKLADILLAGPRVYDSERTRLVQKTGQEVVEILPAGNPPLIPVSTSFTHPLGEPLPFARRADLAGAHAVYSTGLPVPGTPWLVVQEVDGGDALAPLLGYQIVGGTVALLATFLVAAALIAVLIRQNSASNRLLAVQFRDLASRIQAQRQLLDRVNGSIDECIGLKGLDGSYVYVNPAFAKTVGRSIEGIIGRNDEAVFGKEAAFRLKQDDQKVISSGLPLACDIELEIMSEKHFFTMSKSPLRNENEVIIGVVSVARDVTEILEQKRRIESAAQATMAALVHAVELHDPYLSGHSRRMGDLCKEVGGMLRLPEEDLASLEMAANLSQIGKVSIPTEIISKISRLSPSEIKVVQRHINHTGETLKNIDFGMPVTKTVMQMHERLDGSGYPKGLKDQEIDMLGRIIAVCDVYCARIAPRGYRDTIVAEEAIQILENNSEKYDKQVVAALRRYIKTQDDTVK